MSKWAGKFVIGLTGNIGTGKSVVRRMLEHLGAYGMDADSLAHRAIAQDAPGYKPVVKTFGTIILSPNGEVDRQRLGRYVFSDPEALGRLESIVHPLVNQAVDYLAQRVKQPVIVVEAIKLLESDLKNQCDSIWVVTAPPEVQIKRLIKRGTGEIDARLRMQSQPPQTEKITAANVVIRNDDGIEDTWTQVVAAWRKVVPVVEEIPSTLVSAGVGAADMQVVRGRPRHSQEIATLINRLQRSGKTVTEHDVMDMFGDKAFLMLQIGQDLKGLVGWQVENLVSRATDLYVDPALPLSQAISTIVKEMERASQDLQCEVSLIYVPPHLARHEEIWRKLGYQKTLPQALKVVAWREAARESMPGGAVLLFKQLRTDRVLNPI